MPTPQEALPPIPRGPVDGGGPVDGRDSAGGPRVPQLRTHSLHAVRAVGALLVVLAHVAGGRGFEGKVFGPGASPWDALHAATVGVGVDVFLTLSGFFLVLTAAGPRLGERSVGVSLWRRLVRVLPLYWLATTGVLAIALLAPGQVNGGQEVPPDVLASYLLVPQAGLPLLLVGWTLTYVVGFYLVFHLGLLTRSSRGLWTVLAAWGVLVVVVHVVLQFRPEGTGSAGLQTLGTLYNLYPLAGAALAQVLLAGWRRGAVPALVAGAAVLVAVGVLRQTPWAWTQSSELRLFGVCLAVCALLYGLVRLEQDRGWRAPRPLAAVATSSYSLYLVHVPLLGVLALVGARLPLPDTTPARIVVILVAVLVCVAAARLVHRFVEAPLTRYLTALVPRTRASAGARRDREPALESTRP